MKIKERLKYLVAVLLTSMPTLVFASSRGFAKAGAMLGKVKTGLAGLSLVTVTIAILWVGYKILFGGSTLRECAPIIIGAIVIASAAEIASLLVN